MTRPTLNEHEAAEHLMEVFESFWDSLPANEREQKIEQFEAAVKKIMEKPN